MRELRPMQDRYAFDVGDFGKFGLLRHLTEGAGPGALGVLWYATSLASAGDDGKHLGYLELDNFGRLSAAAERYRACDPHLYDAFKRHMQEDRTRSIAKLESVVPLPTARTRFHREMTKSCEARATHGMAKTPSPRDTWFERACATVSECAIVFCDPDNGIANPGSSNERSGSVQHVRVGELEKLHALGHGLVVYHHLNRETGGHGLQLSSWIKRLGSFGSGAVAVKFKRGTSRAFFVIPGDNAPGLVSRLNLLRGSDWVKNGHLEFIERSADQPTGFGESST